ncbi:chemotaxis protein CheA [Bremerella cremea]|uniref:Chemotaxis protein CheA n=1 Tax=Bremerella cremea TaxID=1031537 RepID=A0A368KYZ3_9BACT|nr:chemotaxis protein CheA [Bremerella cremea]RCS56027.1 chemotaxis protein CheA [Bremerella cremea]
MVDKATANDDCNEDLLADFLDESTQLIERLNDRLMELEKSVCTDSQEEHAQVDIDLLNDMFRSAHSIKGLSAMLGLPRINGLTHNIENVFDAARRDEVALNSNVIQVVYASVDRLSELIDHLRVSQNDNLDCTSQLQAISAILEAQGSVKMQGEQSSIEETLEELASSRTEDTSKSVPRETSPLPGQVTVEEKAAQLLAECEAMFHGVVDETEVPAKYLSIFLDETEMSLDEMVDLLLESGSEADIESVRTIMCTAHRIKGSAASIGLNRPAKLAHLMEDVLQRYRDSEQSLSAFLADAMLACADGLRAYTKNLREGTQADVEFAVLASELQAAEAIHALAVEVSQAVSTEEKPDEVLPEEKSVALDRNALLAQAVTHEIKENERLCVVQVELNQNTPLIGVKAQLLIEKLKRLGRILLTMPACEAFDDCENLSLIEVGLLTTKPDKDIFQAINVSGVNHYALEEISQVDTPAPPQEVATTQVIEVEEIEEDQVEIEIALEPLEAEEILAETVSVATPAPVVEKEPVAAAPRVSAVPVTPRNEVAAQATPLKKEAAKTSDNNAKPVETLRVDIDRLDQLMNLAGQLVISKARFNQLGENLRAAMPHKQCQQWLESTNSMCSKLLETSDNTSPLDRGQGLPDIHGQIRKIQQNLNAISSEMQRVNMVRTGLTGFFDAVHQLDRVTDGIQKTIMDTRMVPIGPLFGRFRRVVRDISRTNGKEISLEILGEKTELDKRMIDELGDPLIHMVRNSADHGIESPQDRLAAGKPRAGEITLNAFHRGNSIVIQITDNGRGLSRDKILSKAVERGLINQLDAERMTDQQVYQLIWEPGFSTAETITEISGRGMGMDIVRAKIESINGVVEVDSKPGQGTVFTIRLPLTMAILPSLMAKIDGDLFSIPVESIVEIVCLHQEEVRTIHGKKTTVVRGRPVSVVELHETFRWNSPSPHVDHKADVTMVIIRNDSSELGMVVDGILGEEDVVVKSLAENYQNVEGISGACVLGNGRVALILDPAAVIELAVKRQAEILA